MKGTLLLPLAVLVLATGCGPTDDSSSTASNTPHRDMTNDGAFGQYMGGLKADKQAAGKAVDLASLNRAIDQFYVDKSRYPSDLNELVTEKYISRVPDAPFQRKINYDPTTGKVEVVNQ